MSATLDPPPPTPSAEQIERRFNGTLIRTARPVCLLTLRGVELACGLQWRAVHAERLLEVPQPFILAANHDSHADTAAILGTLPPGLRPRTAVAAANDVFGATRGERRRSLTHTCLEFTVGATFHAFAFDRFGASLRSVRAARTLVKHGWNLLLYPEGTRGRAGVIGPFKSGVGVIAKFTGCPVVPVYASGGFRVLPQGNLLPRRGAIRVHYGDPLQFRPGESADDFADRLRDAVLDLRRRHEPDAGTADRPLQPVDDRTLGVVGRY
jgi:1-acyl-sn-glycerol-3-phosphate acyltransferase